MPSEFDLPYEIDSAKRLAIKLFALHEEDRAWMLAQLDNEARAELLLLIQELSNLGIQLDDADLAQVISGQPQHQQHVMHLNDELSIIDQADLSQIDIIFDGEPAILLQQLIAIKKWRWLADYDVRQDKYHHKPVPIVDGRPTAAVQQSLIKAVAAQLLKQQSMFTTSINPERSVHPMPKVSGIKHKFKAILPWGR